MKKILVTLSLAVLFAGLSYAAGSPFKNNYEYSGKTSAALTISSTSFNRNITEVSFAATSGSSYAIITSSWITGGTYIDPQAPFARQYEVIPIQFKNTGKLITITPQAATTIYYFIGGIDE
jgi:hypothetical protein